MTARWSSGGDASNLITECKLVSQHERLTALLEEIEGSGNHTVGATRRVHHEGRLGEPWRVEIEPDAGRLYLRTRLQGLRTSNQVCQPGDEHALDAQAP